MTPGSGAVRPGQLGAYDTWMRDLNTEDYLVEAWRCDLASCVFHLGRQTATLLGLPTHCCGIVDLVRAYDREDRTTVLNILEQATASPSSFCFKTKLRRPTGGVSQLFCLGLSLLDAPGKHGALQGIFAFPRERVIVCA